MNSFSVSVFRLIAVFAIASLVVACGGDEGSEGGDIPGHTIGGTVGGLAEGRSVTLALGSQTLPISANGSFTFPGQVSPGSAYSVTVNTQPEGQTCSVASGSGTATANVTDIALDCISNYAVGGTVTGLAQGQSVTLALDDQVLAIQSSGDFVFPDPLPNGSSYEVEVEDQPEGQTCIVSNGSGALAGADVGNVAVTCVSNYTVGGTVAGLAAGRSVTLILSDQTLAVTENGGFVFPDALADGSSYEAAISDQPEGQICSVSNGSGALAGADVSNIAVACVAAFTVGGTASGLVAGMTFRLGLGDQTILVSANGSFAFPVALADGSGYAVTGSAGAGAKCEMSGSHSGTLSGSNVTDISVVCEQGSEITFLAGDGTFGFQDGPGAQAQFRQPFGIAVADGGNIYVTDATNHRIRKVGPDGEVSTAVGSGNAGHVNGNALQAALNAPYDVVVDAGGNIYAVERSNSGVRKITAGGLVSTMVGSGGNPGFQDHLAAGDPPAQFNAPESMAIDAAGNIYIADTGNHAIRKVSIDAQGEVIVRTLAGTGAPGFADHASASDPPAQFNRPHGIAVDAAGNVYVSDSFNQRIRKLSTNTEGVTTVSTLAGSGAQSTIDHEDGAQAAFSALRRLAVDADGYVYVAQHNGGRIRKISPSGAVSTIAASPGIPATFNGPYGIAVDADGTLYVSEVTGPRIMKMSGAFTTQ